MGIDEGLAFEVFVQVLSRQAGLVSPLVVCFDLTIFKDNQPVAVLDGVLQVVGDHQGRQVVLGDSLVRGVEEVLTGVGVEGGGVFIQQEDVWPLEGSHQETQGLPLATGEGARCGGHPVFQAVIHGCGQLGKAGHVFLEFSQGEVAAFPPFCCQQQVFCHRHPGRRSQLGVLEDPC